MPRKTATSHEVQEVESSDLKTTSATEQCKTVKKRIAKKRLDPNTIVDVTNGFHGILVYVDKKTGEQYKWMDFGDTITMELEIVQRAKSAQKRFFSENWWMLDDPEVIEYLGVAQYYKNALTVDGFDSIFGADASDIGEIVEKLSKNQKNGVKYRAKQLIETEQLSDLKVIRALEKALNTELIVTSE